MRENQGKKYTLISFINLLKIFSKVFSDKNLIWWITPRFNTNDNVRKRIKNRCFEFGNKLK